MASQLEHILGRPPERVLTIRLGAVGDVVTTLPSLAQIRRLLPNATIHHLVDEGASGVVSELDWLDEVIVVPREAVYQELRHLSFATLRRLRDRLADGAYDVVIDFQSLARSALLALFTQAPLRIGKALLREAAFMASNLHIPINQHENVILQQLDLLRPLTEDRQRPVAERVPLYPTERAKQEAALVMQQLNTKAGFVALAPGSRWPARGLPDELTLAVGRELMRRGFEVVLTGGPLEGDRFKKLSQLLGCRYTTTLSIGGLTAFLHEAALLVCADSAPMHLADMSGLPIVAVFGPSSPQLYGPLFAPNRCIRQWHGKHDFRGGQRDCFAGIEVATVMRAVQELVALPSSGGQPLPLRVAVAAPAPNSETTEKTLRASRHHVG